MKNCRIVEFKYDNGDTEYKIENRVLRTNFFGKKYYEWVPFQYDFYFDRLIVGSTGTRWSARRRHGWKHTTFNSLEEAEHALPQFEAEFNELNKPNPKLLSKTAIGGEESEIYHEQKFQNFLDILWRTTVILFFAVMIAYGIVSLSF